MLNTRIFYQTILRKNIILESLQKNFYQKLVKFSNQKFNDKILFDDFSIDNIFNNLVNEIHQDCKLKKSLINLINKTENFQQIKLSDILNNISNKLKIKYNINLSNDIPIYVFKFDFLNPTIILSIFKSFNIDYQSKNLNISILEKRQIEQNTFSKNVGEATGLYFNAKNCLLLFLNTNKSNYYNQFTITHEIFHLIQDIFKIEINIDKINLIDIPCLQLSKQQLQYLYSKKEFEVHIKIDLIAQLEQIYWKFYKHISKKTFIEIFILQAAQNPTSIYENEIIEKVLYYHVKHEDLTAYRLFLSTFLIKNKKHNNLAIKWLKESFTN